MITRQVARGDVMSLMSPRELRKKALKLRTRAISEPYAQMQASYRAMANVYDALAKAFEDLERRRAALRLAGRRQV